MTDGQVRIAIAVLRAYVEGTLSLDGALADDLEDAIEEAFDSRCEDIDDRPPLASSV